MVMGDDSCLRGCDFESRRRTLNGHDSFFTLICCKNCYDFCLKRQEINEKEAGVGPLKNLLEQNVRLNNDLILKHDFSFHS